MKELKSASEKLKQLTEIMPFELSERIKPYILEYGEVLQQNAIEASLELAQADVRNKLSPISNLLAILSNSTKLLHENRDMHKMALEELRKSLESVEYLSSILSLINHPKLKSMRKKELIERDKKNLEIACFLGGSDNNGYEYSAYTMYDAQKLRFHSDYNWLMKAWVKLRDMKLYDFEFNRHRHLIETCICKHTISEAFDALYEAINWLNSLKK